MSADDRIHTKTPDLTPGYAVREYEAAEAVIASGADADIEGLLNLILLGDQRSENDHREPLPHQDWEAIRDQAGAVLLHRLQGQGADEGEAETINADWYDHAAIWQPRNYRQALHDIGGMPDADLLTLYVQAAENAYLHEGEPMEARWRKVVIACRDEVARRVSHTDKADDTSSAPTEFAAASADGPASGGDADDAEDGEDDETDIEDDYVSLRDLLRVAEQVFRPDMPDAQLLDLYVMARHFVSPDAETVFDDMFDEATEMLMQRLDLDSLERVSATRPSFDYPDQGEEALSAVLTGKLPSDCLVNLYMLSWDDQDKGSAWTSVADLSRAQLLCRMNPQTPYDRQDSYDAWACAAHVRRLLSHQGVNLPKFDRGDHG
ncbi:MAG: hypothetical protein ACTHLA_10100 [Asticcacaulis sp.]|uniref:hypothetical protein n=1 Tax=Asticcacaulis sp. TaxID=1872648 RepID=UPI003F7BC869